MDRLTEEAKMWRGASVLFPIQRTGFHLYLVVGWRAESCLCGVKIYGVEDGVEEAGTVQPFSHKPLERPPSHEVSLWVQDMLSLALCICFAQVKGDEMQVKQLQAALMTPDSKMILGIIKV